MRGVAPEAVDRRMSPNIQFQIQTFYMSALRAYSVRLPHSLTLPLDGVIKGHHRRLRTRGVSHQRALHLCSSYPVPAHIDHVVHAAGAAQVWM